MEFKKKTIIWEDNNEPPKDYIWVKSDGKAYEYSYSQRKWIESKLIKTEESGGSDGGDEGDGTIKFGEALNQVCFFENQTYGNPDAFLLLQSNLFSLDVINLENPITVGDKTFDYANDANSENCKFKTFDELVQDDFSDDFSKAYFCWKLEKIGNSIEIPAITLYVSPYGYEPSEYYYNIFGRPSTSELIYYNGEYYLTFEFEGD